jgi:hypothetical protein
MILAFEHETGEARLSQRRLAMGLDLRVEDVKQRVKQVLIFD